MQKVEVIGERMEEVIDKILMMISVDESMGRSDPHKLYEGWENCTRVRRYIENLETMFYGALVLEYDSETGNTKFKF